MWGSRFTAVADLGKRISTAKILDSGFLALLHADGKIIFKPDPITGVTQAADSTLARAQDSQKAAQELAVIATELSTLMRQFKIERSDRRYDISLPVRLTAVDANGQPFEQDVMTSNISWKGALLNGVRGKLHLESPITLSRLNRQEEFLVAWIGEQNTPKAGQIGVSSDSVTSFWDDAIESQSAHAEDGHANRRSPEKLKARAHGA